MRKTLTFLLAGGLLCGAAGVRGAEEKRITLMSAYDLDGEAADPDQVVTAVAIVDSKTDYVIAAQPDACRLLDLTIVDTNLNSGTLTVTGTDCLGQPLVAVFAFTSGDDTGVKSLTVSGEGTGVYFKTVTGVATGVMVGESDETFALGYSTGPALTWGEFGKILPNGPNGERRVDPDGFESVPLKVTTVGLYSTTVTTVATNAAFTDVTVGDLLFIALEGVTYERKVTARASADSITINQGITIPAVGVSFSYKHFYDSTNPADLVGIISTDGWKAANFIWSVDANADTGGVITSLLCSPGVGPEWPSGRWVEVDTTTVVSGGTQVDTVESVDLSLASFQFCRFGFKFGTGDDADAAPEDINLEVVLSR